MAIPELDERGFLPPGIHDTTIDEIATRFGQFLTNDRRVRLCERLKGYLEAVRSTQLVSAVIVNGSFISAKESPSDIDLILILPAEHDFAAVLSPFEESVLSARAVRRRLKFDVLVAAENSSNLSEYAEFFQKIKHRPGEAKGILKVQL